MRKGMTPFTYPLACIRPGVRLGELLVRIHRSKLTELWQGIGTVPIMSTAMPDPHDPDYCVVQMFVEIDRLEDVREWAEKIADGEVQVAVSNIMELGWGLDRLFFPILFGRLRLIGLIGPLFIMGVHDMREEVGYASDVFLYHLGFKYGFHLAEHMLKQLGLKPGSFSREEILSLVEYFSDYARIVGFAIIEPVTGDLEKAIFEFKMRDCWEAVLHLEVYGKSERPVCFFTKGNIAGVASYVLGIEIVADEIQCQAMGADYCLVRLRPAKQRT